MYICVVFVLLLLFDTAVGPATPTQAVTGLRVAEVTETEVLLGWVPVPGATGYYLSWRRDGGKSLHHYTSLPCFSLTPSLHLTPLF